MDSPQESKESVSSYELGQILKRLNINGLKSSNSGGLETVSSQLDLVASSSSDSDCEEQVESYHQATLGEALPSEPEQSPTRSLLLPGPDTNSELEVIDLVASSDDSEDEDGIYIFPSAVKRRQNVIDSDSSSSGGSGSGSDDDDVNAVPEQPSYILPSITSILGGGSSSINPPNYKAAATIQPSLPTWAYEPSTKSKTDKDKRSFKDTRYALSNSLYTKYNALIFNNALPSTMEITWNKRLATTAGLTHYRREVPADPHATPRYTARIELSCKVVDDASKLERTLIHEMCHCAAWLIDHVAKPPHGPVFKKWADRAMRALPGIDVSTCHQYNIFYAFRWQCGGCQLEYGRHSNSIDVSKKVCGRCRGRLQYLGKFNKDSGSPVKTRKPSAYSEFVKENFAEVKKEFPPGTQATEVMKALSSKWAEKRRGGGSGGGDGKVGSGGGGSSSSALGGEDISNVFGGLNI